jgi:extradiol dioxygenase family protein
MADNPRADTSGPLAEFTTRPVFQLAVPARDLAAMRRFYVDVLGSRVAREAPAWLEFSFFGGRLIAYQVNQMPAGVSGARGGRPFPIPSYGLLMGWEDWHRAVDHLSYVGIAYHQAPATFTNEDGEVEAWFAIADPAGNVLTFGAERGD